MWRILNRGHSKELKKLWNEYSMIPDSGMENIKLKALCSVMDMIISNLALDNRLTKGSHAILDELIDDGVNLMAAFANTLLSLSSSSSSSCEIDALFRNMVISKILESIFSICSSPGKLCEMFSSNHVILDTLLTVMSLISEESIQLLVSVFGLICSFREENLIHFGLSRGFLFLSQLALKKEFSQMGACVLTFLSSILESKFVLRHNSEVPNRQGQCSVHTNSFMRGNYQAHSSKDRDRVPEKDRNISDSDAPSLAARGFTLAFNVFGEIFKLAKTSSWSLGRL